MHLLGNGKTGGVDFNGAGSLFQRSMRPAGVLFIPVSDVRPDFFQIHFHTFLQKLLLPAEGTLFNTGKHINFQIGVGKHHRTDVPAIHYYPAVTSQFLLFFHQDFPHFGVRCHRADIPVDLGGANSFRNIFTIHKNHRIQVIGSELQIGFCRQFRHRIPVIDRDVLPQGFQGYRTVHCPGIDVGISQFPGDQTGSSAFAAGSGTVNSDNQFPCFTHWFFSAAVSWNERTFFFSC